MRTADEIKAKIYELELKLTIEKNRLFMLRLFKLLNIDRNDLLNLNVKNLLISVVDDKWNISYDHSTNNYDENNYNHSYDSDADLEPREKSTHVSFGYNNKLFLRGKGIRMSRFKLYRNSRGKLRIINNDYRFELDTEEQFKLISSYRKNKHVPEWLALNVFLYMCEHQWETENIIMYLSKV